MSCIRFDSSLNRMHTQGVNYFRARHMRLNYKYNKTKVRPPLSVRLKTR